jgi:hypothetical protein
MPNGLQPYTFVFENAQAVWVALLGTTAFKNVGTLQKFAYVSGEHAVPRSRWRRWRR